ncbi:VOC family protein [Clostridium pasteurianum]|uniref:Lactoylglutathione lyase family protein n=1 Tax=Clostridium pasteurianum BC1 TaxID=86416 RepID=R4K0L7_CLOPA|nr:VOC family protein [Clostridium pasteurianum]AGK96103.1 lactoylglutathione lyase family protein [Clostridium pasteurianum BC1]
MGLLKCIDCIELYVPDLKAGVDYYSKLGLKVLWKNDTSVGMGLEDDFTEILLQNERKKMNVDIKVESVIKAVEKIKESGGQVIYGPFDIPIGKCAVVRDKWSNKYVILDMTKGRYVTDKDGNIIDIK